MQGADLVSRRVVALVLVVTLAVSSLQHFEYDRAAETGLTQLLAFDQQALADAGAGSGLVAAFNESVASYQDAMGDDLLFLRVYGTDYTPYSTAIDDRRSTALLRIADPTSDSQAVIDYKDVESEKAMFSLLTMAAVVVILVAGASAGGGGTRGSCASSGRGGGTH